MRKTVLIGFTIAAMTTGALAQAPAAQPAPGGNAAAGQRAFTEYACYYCHGTVGQGSLPTIGPRVARVARSFDSFRSYVRRPAGRMSSYPASVIGDDTLADIYAYLRSLPEPKPLPAMLEQLRSAPQAPAPATQTTRMVITLPNNETTLEIDGTAIPGTGVSRTYDTPPLAINRTYQYKVVAKWAPNTYTNMTRTKTVSFRAGERVTIDLSVDDPTDRVVVRYVPTPEHIVAEMVKLAGVTAADVTYEPGCGDARITIAAVKAGARRGVGVDLDPERVTESRFNVSAAGLADRIDIRLGDALEQPDLGSMTVVFLYMGDHFNMLIRPYLWKQLPVGARVVSHRFLMGDWKPDKSVTVAGDYGEEYELHLWTITEAHKRMK